MIGTRAIHLAALSAAPDVTGTTQKSDLNARRLTLFDNASDLADKIEIQNIVSAGGQRLTRQLQ